VSHPPGPLLADRVALVTGGGGGIGRGIAETFAAHGARVVIAEVDEGRAVETAAAIVDAGGVASAAVVDVRDEDAVAALAATTGAVDVLVNNVGHYLPGSGDFLTSTPDEWRELYRVNFEHVLLCTRAFVPGMVERGRGNVINVSSVEAFRAIPRRPVYSAFKGAITQFTKSLAVELGNSGVRINAIAPDLTETLQVPYSRWVPPEQQELIPQWVPVGRFGTPDDIAGVALFLASDLAAFVTGTTVHADGGSLAAGGWFRRPDGTWTNRPERP
jgi:NAD(P)-dependent dehydrogenase (short-subunit alcohol dehydrogenase family)